MQSTLSSECNRARVGQSNDLHKKRKVTQTQSLGNVGESVDKLGRVEEVLGSRIARYNGREAKKVRASSPNNNNTPPIDKSRPAKACDDDRGDFVGLMQVSPSRNSSSSSSSSSSNTDPSVYNQTSLSSNTCDSSDADCVIETEASIVSVVANDTGAAGSLVVTASTSSIEAVGIVVESSEVKTDVFVAPQPPKLLRIVAPKEAHVEPSDNQKVSRDSQGKCSFMYESVHPSA
jgi:hypothetical protein